MLELENVDIGRLKDEWYLTLGALVVLYFLWVNVSPQVSSFYVGFGLLYYIALSSPLFSEVEIRATRQDVVKAFIAAFTVFVGWVFLSSAIFNYTGGSVQMGLTVDSFRSFFSQMALFTNVPVLGTDPAMKLLLYGFIIPLIESLFFLSVGLILAARIANVDIRWHSLRDPDFIKMIWACLIVGVMASAFHWNARLLNDSMLIIDVLFFSLSVLMVFASTSKIALIGESKNASMLPGVMFHMLVNVGFLILGGVL